MELSKVLDGFIDSDTLIIKAQVQVIRSFLIYILILLGSFDPIKYHVGCCGPPLLTSL